MTDKDSVDLIRVFQHLPMSTVLLFKVHLASQVRLPVPKRLHLGHAGRLYLYFGQTHMQTHMTIWLVVSTPPNNMTVSWDHYSQYMGN